MKIEGLSVHHQFVWSTLQLLEDGERIIGADLQARTGIQDKRMLYQVINDLRRNGFLVGSSKKPEKSGYFEIRDEQDLNNTLSSLRDAAFNQLATAKRIELAFYTKQYGVLPLEIDEVEKKNND